MTHRLTRRTGPALLPMLLVCSACAHGPAPTATTAAETPASLLEDVAHGRRTLLSLGAPREGFGYVLHRTDPSDEDPRRDEEGRIRFAQRVCSAEQVRELGIERSLALHYEPEFDYVPVVCDGLICNAGGPMEYATSLRFVFERGRTGSLLLRTVYEVEDVAILDEFVHQAWNWAEAQAEELPERCP